MIKKKSLKLLGYSENQNGKNFKVIKNQIFLDNISKEYIFWQISDCHVCFTQKPKLINKYKSRLDHWTIDGYDNPLFSFDKLINNANKKDLDGIFFCGDIIDFYSKENVKYVNSKLKKINKDILITLGNHERSENPYSDNEINFYNSFKYWAKEKLSYYSIDYKDFLIAVIDDSEQKINNSQLDFLKSLSKMNKPIFLVLHIPIIDEDLAPKCMEVWGPTFMLGTNICDRTTLDFVDYVKSDASNVKAIFAGHIHYENVSKFKTGCYQYCNDPSFLGFIREIVISPKHKQ